MRKTMLTLATAAALGVATIFAFVFAVIIGAVFRSILHSATQETIWGIVGVIMAFYFAFSFVVMYYIFWTRDSVTFAWRWFRPRTMRTRKWFRELARGWDAFGLRTSGARCLMEWWRPSW